MPPRPNRPTADLADGSLGELVETLTLRAGFNTNLVIAGATLLGLAAGIVGVFALLRKRSLMADALSHATLPGIAIAFLGAAALGLGRSLPLLLVGATITGVLGVLTVQAILRFSRLREDAAIGAVLSVFFGAGVVLLSYIQANAASDAAGLYGFIYGQAATMQPADVALMGAIAGASILATILFLKEFAMVSFNDAFARVGGWPVTLIDLLMMALVVLVTVAGLQAVGVIMVVAMLIIPAVAARFWTDRLWRLVLIAGLFGAASGYLGAVASALLPNMPAGAVIVLTSGAFFALSLIVAPSRGVCAAALRRLRLRVRIAADHLLEAAHVSETTTLSRDSMRTLMKAHGWNAALRVLVRLSLRSAGLAATARPDGLRLTTAGLTRGARVARNHALWEQYLINHADIAPNHVDWSVDQVEHVLTDELIEELEASLASRGVSIRAYGGRP